MQGADINAVQTQFKTAQDFQMKLMEAQTKHSMIMSAIQAMKAAFDKIRA